MHKGTKKDANIAQTVKFYYKQKSDYRDFGSCFYVDSQRRNHLYPTIKPPRHY